MKEKIIETLQKLDPQNSNQWTQDGLPKVDILKFLSGGESWTREQISDAAPGFTRDNPVIGSDSDGQSYNVDTKQPVEGEQGQGAAQEQSSTEQKTESNTEGSVEQPKAQEDETNVVTAANGRTSKLTVDVAINFPDLIKNFMLALDFADVKAMSDEDLADLAERHSDILSADNQFLSEVNEFVTKRAHYLNAVVEEYSKRTPAESQADMLAQFHESVFKNQQNLPINKPRLLQTRGPQYFGK